LEKTKGGGSKNSNKNCSTRRIKKKSLIHKQRHKKRSKLWIKRTNSKVGSELSHPYLRGDHKQGDLRNGHKYDRLRRHFSLCPGLEQRPYIKTTVLGGVSNGWVEGFQVTSRNPPNVETLKGKGLTRARSLNRTKIVRKRKVRTGKKRCPGSSHRTGDIVEKKRGTHWGESIGGGGGKNRGPGGGTQKSNHVIGRHRAKKKQLRGEEKMAFWGPIVKRATQQPGAVDLSPRSKKNNKGRGKLLKKTASHTKTCDEAFLGENGEKETC